MLKSKAYKLTLGIFALLAWWGIIYLCYNWLGKELATSIQLVFAGYMLFVHVVLFRSPAIKAGYFNSLKRQKHMTPKMRKAMIVMATIPTIVGLTIAGWWVCLAATVVWSGFMEYDFRTLMADNSVNTQA